MPSRRVSKEQYIALSCKLYYAMIEERDPEGDQLDDMPPMPDLTEEEEAERAELLDRLMNTDDVQEQVAVLQAQIDELLSQPCGDDDACDVELYAVEGEDVYDSMGIRRECCPGLEPTLEDRDPSDPLIGTWPQIIVCREPSVRRNLRGEAKA